MKLHTALILALVFGTVFTVDARRRRPRPSTTTPRPVGTTAFPVPETGGAYPRPTRRPPINLGPVTGAPQPARRPAGGASALIRTPRPTLDEPISRGPSVAWYPTLEI